MQYMLLLYSDEAAMQARSEAESRDGTAAYMAYTQAMQEAGVMVSGNRLQFTSAAATVRIADGKTRVLDGPYADTKEQLGGYYLIEAPNLDVALSWAARCPAAARGSVEVRPVWAM